MAEELSYLQELLLEKDSLDPSFVHAQRLLLQGMKCFSYFSNFTLKFNLFFPDFDWVISKSVRPPLPLTRLLIASSSSTTFFKETGGFQMFFLTPLVKEEFLSNFIVTGISFPVKVSLILLKPEITYK